MHQMTKGLLFLMLLFISILLSSCQQDDVEPRTREMEMAELNARLKELEAKGADIDTTDMSVFYIIRKKGEGPFPKTGDLCYVSYKGYLLDGKKIEDSDDIYGINGTWKFSFKANHKVIGLNNGIGYMNKGAQIEMYITSDLAYGSKGARNIPPYSTLIFWVTMHDIEPAN